MRAVAVGLVSLALLTGWAVGSAAGGEAPCADLRHLRDGRVRGADDGDAVFTVGVAASGARFLYVVRACHRESGRVLWEDVLPPTSSSSANAATAESGRVFVAGGVDYDWPYSGTDALVRAYHARTGALLWQERRGAPGFHERAFAIAAGGGRLYVLSGVWEIGVGARERAIRAYDPATGTLRWEHREPVAADVRVGPSALNLAGNRVFTVGSAGRVGESSAALLVQAYDATTGEKLWEERRPEPGGDPGAPRSIGAPEAPVLARR